MVMPTPYGALPPGSDRIASWAQMRGFAFRGRPEPRWFRKWEPFDTIVAPEHYFNAVTWTNAQGHVVIVEPWTAPEDTEPLARTIVAFGTHRGLRGRVSAKAGDPFLTRVAFLESPPPPEVTIGDDVWDQNVKTYCRSQEQARTVFHRRLRKLIGGWGFSGQIEFREGGVVLHYDGLRPVPEDYDRLLRILNDLVGVATSPA